MDQDIRVMSTGIQEILEQMLKNLECPICLELMNNPVSTICNHRFCSFCINSFFKAQRSLPCPLCKALVTKRSIEEQSQLSNVIQKIKQLIETFEADTGTKLSPVKNASTFFPSTPEALVTKRKSNAKRKQSAESFTRVLRSRSCSSEKAKDQDTSRNNATTKLPQGISARKKISYEKQSFEIHDDSTSNVGNEGVSSIFEVPFQNSNTDSQLRSPSTTNNCKLSVPGSNMGHKSKEDNTSGNLAHITDWTDVGSRSSDVKEDHVDLLQYLEKGSFAAVHETTPLVCSFEKDFHVYDEGKEEIEPASSRKAKTEKRGHETRKRKSIGVSNQNSSPNEDILRRNIQPRYAKVRSHSPSEPEPQSEDFLLVKPVTRTYARDMRLAFKAEKADAVRRSELKDKEENPFGSSLAPEKFEAPVVHKEQKKKAHSPVPRNLRNGKCPNKQDVLLVEETEHRPEVISKIQPPLCHNRHRIFRNKSGLCNQDLKAREEQTVFPLTLSQDPFEFKGETPTEGVKKGAAKGRKGKAKKSKAPPLNYCHSYRQTEEAYLELESNGDDQKKTSKNTHNHLYNESDGRSMPYQKDDSSVSSKNEQCFDIKAKVTNDGICTDVDMDSQIELFSGRDNCSNHTVEDVMIEKVSNVNNEIKSHKKRTSKRNMSQKSGVMKTDEITVASQEVRKMQSKISEAEIHELMFSTQEAQQYIQEQEATVHENRGSIGPLNSPVKEEGTLKKNILVENHVKVVPINSLSLSTKDITNISIISSQSGGATKKVPDTMEGMETDSTSDILNRDNIHGDDGETYNKGQHKKDQHPTGELADDNDTEQIDNSCAQATVDLRENHNGKSEAPMHNHERTDNLTIIERQKTKPQFSLPNLSSMTPFNPMFVRSLPNSPATSCKVTVICETPLTGSLALNSIEVMQNCESEVTKESSNNQLNEKISENDLPVCKTTKGRVECSDETPLNISRKELSGITGESKSPENPDLTNKTESQVRTCSNIVPMSADILPQKAEKLCFNDRGTLSLKSRSMIESEKDKEIAFHSEIDEDCHTKADVLAPDTCVEDPVKQNNCDSHNPLGVTFIPETELLPTLDDVEVLSDWTELSQTKQPQQERDGQKRVNLNTESSEKDNAMSQLEQALTYSQPISSTYVVVQEGRREWVANELPVVDSEESSDSFSQGDDTMVSSAKSLVSVTLSNNVTESLFSGDDTVTPFPAESHLIRDEASCSDRLNLSFPHKNSLGTEAQDKKADGPKKVNHCISIPEIIQKEIVYEDLPQSCESTNEVQDISDYENDECVLMFHSGNENSLKEIQHLTKPLVLGNEVNENNRTETVIPHPAQPKKLIVNKETDMTYSEVNNEEETSNGKCIDTESQDEFYRRSESLSHKSSTKLTDAEVGRQKELISSGASMVKRVDAIMASNCHTVNENMNSMEEAAEGESQSILYLSDGSKNEECQNDCKILEGFPLSSSKSDDSLKNSLRQVTKPLCENLTPQKMARKVASSSLSSWKTEQCFEETSTPSKKRAWTTEEDVTPPKKKAISSGNNSILRKEQADLSRKHVTPSDSEQVDQVNTENSTLLNLQPSEEHTTSMNKLESSKKKTKRGLALKNNEIDFNSLPQHPNGRLSPAAKAALDLEFSKISKIPEFEGNAQKLKESATKGDVKDHQSSAEVETNLVSNDDYSPYEALDELCHTVCDVEKEMCGSDKDILGKVQDSEKSQRYTGGKESVSKDFQEDTGKRQIVAIENTTVSENSFEEKVRHKVLYDNSLKNFKSNAVMENNLEKLTRDSIASEGSLEELNGEKVDTENSQDFDKHTNGEENCHEETTMKKFNEASSSPSKSSQHDGNVNQVEDVAGNEVLEKCEESPRSPDDIGLSFDLGISLDEEDCDTLLLNHSGKVNQPDYSLRADEKPQEQPEMLGCKEILQDDVSSKAIQIVEVEMVEESDLEDSPITVPKTSSPMMPENDLGDDVEESVVCEDDDEEDENGGCIRLRKKRRRLQISSDSEEESDTEKNLSQDNATSSSAFSSQSELLNTQQQEALEKDVDALQQDIAQCEAALHDIDDSGPQTQIPKAQSSSVKNDVEVVDEVNDEKKPSAISEAEEKDGENSEDDLFICISSPSPQKPQFSTLVQRVPVLNKENPGLRSKFFKQFQSPGGSVHKRRALEFTQQSSKTERDSDCIPTNEPTSPVISSQGGRSLKPSHKSGTKTDSATCPSNYDTISMIASGLKGQEQEILKKFRHHFHVKFSAKFVPGVTHVIVKSVKNHNFMCERTLKLFQGLVHKAWILDFSWIQQSLEEGRILKEDEFEICGDTCTGELSYGPKKARLSSQPLLTNFSFACIGNCNELPRNELKELLVACGACVVEDIIALPLSSSRHKFIIRCNDSDEEPSSMEKIMLKKRGANVTVGCSKEIGVKTPKGNAVQAKLECLSCAKALCKKCFERKHNKD